jgi:hypothetical protein
LHEDLETGIHLNKTSNPEYFTTAYFHTPREIKEEIKESGLNPKDLVAVESFGWIVNDFESKVNDNVYMGKMKKFLDKLESNDDLIAMSPHIIAVGKKD